MKFAHVSRIYMVLSYDVKHCRGSGREGPKS